MTRKQLANILDWLLMYNVIDTKEYNRIWIESLPYLSE